MDIDLINKLWKQTEIKDGHWLWTGAKLKSGGHGQAFYNGKKWVLSRLSLCIYLKLPYRGSWQANHIDSICKYKECWNPLHLYQGTATNNAMDRVRNGNHNQANKTHCKRGHEYTSSSTYLYRGERRCKECGRLNCKTLYRKKRRQFSEVYS